MKKINIALAVLAIVASSCSKENLGTSGNANPTNTLTAYAPAGTKTAFGETEGKETKMTWAEGDELYVMGASDWLTPHKYTLDAASAGQAKGVFTSADPTTETGNIAAFYPYSWSTKKNDYNQITIPSTQTPATIGAGVMPMYGKGTVAEGLTFEHLGSILRLKFYTIQAGKTLSKVSVTNDNYIAGRYYTITYEHLNYASGWSCTIDYTCEQPLSTDSSNPTIVDILIMARGGKTLSNFTVDLICTDGSIFTRTMTGTKDVAAGSIVTFTALECSLTSDLQISYDGGNNWVDFDGTVVIPDACTDIAVKGEEISLSNLSLSNIKSAIEALPSPRQINLDLSGVAYESTTWPTTFSGAERLADFKLPNNITSISDQAFKSSSVGEVTIPATCTNVGAMPLRSCKNAHFAVASGNTALKIIEGSLYSADGTIFVCPDCRKTAISIAEGCTTIKAYALMSDEKVETLTLPSTLVSILDSSLGGTLRLNTIDASVLTEVPTLGPFYYNMTNLAMYPGYDIATGKKIIVAAGKVDAFSSADGWKNFLTPTPEGTYNKWTPWVITSDGL